MTKYQHPIFDRLEPRTPWQGGRITDTDVLNLTEAARLASVHAGAEITPADFLRAGARGEISLSAIVHQRAKVQAPGGGVCINEGHPTDENVIPKGAIPTLPLKACQQLAAAGRASWRTFDGFELVRGELCRYTKFELTDDEPDFATTPDDCRLTGYNVHALADAFIDEPAPASDTATPAPVVAASTAPNAKHTARKPTIESVAFDYMREAYKAGQFQSATKFHKHLCKTAGQSGSPFEMGTGEHARKLFCPAASSFFDPGTLSKMWARIRAA